MSRRLDDIADANIAVTPGLKAIRAAISNLSHKPGLCAISGPIGTGRRTSLTVALKEAHLANVWLSLPPAYGTRDLISDLHAKLIGQPDDMTLRQLQDDVLEVLHQRPLAVCVINAERLSLEASGQLHWLHDRAGSRWTLILLGAPQFAGVLKRQAHLREGIDLSVQVQKIPKTEIGGILDQIHYMFASTNRELISQIDSKVCRGLLSRWIRFLHACLEISEERQVEIPILDTELAQEAIMRLPMITERKSRQ